MGEILNLEKKWVGVSASFIPPTAHTCFPCCRSGMGIPYIYRMSTVLWSTWNGFGVTHLSIPSFAHFIHSFIDKYMLIRHWKWSKEQDGQGLSWWGWCLMVETEMNNRWIDTIFKNKTNKQQQPPKGRAKPPDLSVQEPNYFSHTPTVLWLASVLARFEMLWDITTKLGSGEVVETMQDLTSVVQTLLTTDAR